MCSGQINRLHKMLDDAGIKLGAVVGDLHGVSARVMVRGLIEALARVRLNPLEVGPPSRQLFDWKTHQQPVRTQDVGAGQSVSPKFAELVTGADEAAVDEAQRGQPTRSVSSPGIALARGDRTRRAKPLPAVQEVPQHMVPARKSPTPPGPMDVRWRTRRAAAIARGCH